MSDYHFKEGSTLIVKLLFVEGPPYQARVKVSYEEEISEPTREKMMWFLP